MQEDHRYERNWSRFFGSAALFNVAMGLPILFAPRFSFDLAHLAAVPREPMTLRLWANFGFMVLLIGLGYQLVARDVRKNRGIVLLGIFAKGFDVVNLMTLYLAGLAHALVLVPAAIDGAYAVGFVVFWLRSRPGDKIDASL